MLGSMGGRMGSFCFYRQKMSWNLGAMYVQFFLGALTASRRQMFGLTPLVILQVGYSDIVRGMIGGRVIALLASGLR